MPTFAQDIHAARRQVLISRMREACGSSVAIFPAAPALLRNNDTDFAYRQESNFQYLSGFDEPESVLVVDAEKGTTTLFVRRRDPDREVWDGPRAGVGGAKEDYGVDAAFEIGAFYEELPRLLAGRKRLYMRLSAVDRALEAKVVEVLAQLRTRTRTAACPPSEIVDSGELVHEMRLFKSEPELSFMQKACAISADAHRAAMGFARPGMAEHQVEALLLSKFRAAGAERLAYNSIVGSGPNACVLHYVKNNRAMHPGELLLIDAGCEYGYYASDITRTFPISGEFTREQQAVYEVVLDAQLACIEATRPGATINGIHAVAVEQLVRGLSKLGLLSESVSESIAKETYRRFYMHRTSHWLGMDVHDVGRYFTGEESRTLESGMVITVEPGLYISPTDDSVPPSFRGIGVRIEDDLAVTASGNVNLTAAAPKTVAELRAAWKG